MISIYDSSGNRLALTYNGYTLNSMSAVEGEPGMQGTEVKAIAYTSPADFISEKLQWRDGVDVNAVTRSSRMIQVNGLIRGTTRADLKDRIKAFSHAFDPGWIAYANSDPFLPLTFSVPTTDTTNFPTGLAASKVFVLPIETPMPSETHPQSRDARFRLTLLQKDPKRYLQTPVTHNSGTLSNPAADTTSWPTLSFTMSGAGHASFTATRAAGAWYGGAAQPLVLDLSGRSAGQVITVDFANRQVKVNGTVTAGIFVSGSWWEVEPGNQLISYTNTTNVGTRTITVYPAFSF